MSQGSKIAAAVAGGYVLGRRRKLKLALGVGAWLLRRRAGRGAGGLTKGVTDQLGQVAGLDALKQQLRGELANAGKAAVTTVGNELVQSLADNLHRRTERLSQAVAGATGQQQEQDQQQEQEEQAQEREEQERQPEAEGEGTAGRRAPAAAAGGQGPQERAGGEAGRARRAAGRARSTTESGPARPRQQPTDEAQPRPRPRPRRPRSAPRRSTES